MPAPYGPAAHNRARDHSYTATVWPGMAMGYLPFASGMAGGLESQV